jgi:hypothetical protein
MYKRNANGVPIYWSATAIEGYQYINCRWGVVNEMQQREASAYPVKVKDRSKVAQSLNSMIASKRKEGYIEFNEVHDGAPDEDNISDGEKFRYLATYLPAHGIVNGEEQVMLAKIFEPEKAYDYFDKDDYLAQTKINGWRCNIKAYVNPTLFSNYGLKFFSRTGVEFLHIPQTLHDNLLNAIPLDLIQRMVEGECSLDGELYIPGAMLNVIQTAIASPDMTLPDKQRLQYWLYDLIIDDVPQETRLMQLDRSFAAANSPYHPDFTWMFREGAVAIKEFHLNNKLPLVYIGWQHVQPKDVLELRNRFTYAKFEGVILRKANGTYQFGKRNLTMLKYKPVYDGHFAIADIVAEEKRSDFGKLVLVNDLNGHTFTCSVASVFSVKKLLLSRRDKYIGMAAHVEYRDRTGVNNLPAHAVCVGIDGVNFKGDGN